MERPSWIRSGADGRGGVTAEALELFARRGEALCGLADDTDRGSARERAGWVLTTLTDDPDADGWAVHEAMVGTRPADDA
ncbi:hypothetical protein [Rhabdothermincola sediminis]|uniref:hypothetical protein n=1 Tax=Rhabdothermincola sediminis TaxID=2751370 RepID=UPI001AA08172|nr:hypothetical protein [Rhabdothermincola sediminis]